MKGTFWEGQPFASPGEALEHYGVKGQRWGVRKEEDLVGFKPGQPLTPGTPEFQRMIERVTRTDNPQVLGTKPPPRVDSSGKLVGQQKGEEKKGLTRNQKLLITFGAVSAAAAGYYAYNRFKGGPMPDLAKIVKEEKKVQEQLGGMKIPKSWDVSGLKNGPISKQNLGDLSGGNFNAKLLDADNLVINTSRGYADILPKGGFSNPFAAEQHASVTRVLEEMRDKYPSIRNMNIEVIPMSKVPGLGQSQAHMCVMPMRAGEARVMYNDLMEAPSARTIRDNLTFLPGLGKKDYVAYHEMGHLFAVANGDLPPAFNILSGEAGPGAMAKRQAIEPLLHRRTFTKFGFTFKELSKLSGYAATEPAEAMAEVIGHYLHPEMRKTMTPEQVSRAKAMVDYMGGLT